MSVKLLIVDDEPKLRDLLVGILSQDGLKITTASSGAEALTLISQNPPQLMILDVRMAEMDGLEVLRRVKATAPQIGVFLLTGFDDDTIEQEGRTLGALGIIHKPPAFAEIRQLIKDAIAKLPPS